MSPLIATPYSTLFATEKDRRDILSMSDAVELRHPEHANCTTLPQLFHCESSLVEKWRDEETKKLVGLAKRTKLELVSFHVNSKYQANILINGRYHGVGCPYSEDELLQNAGENTMYVRSIFGSSVPILVENNNHLGTDAYDIITEGEFLFKLVETHHLHLLWDVAHSIITAFNQSISVESYLGSLPLERCLQVHLSRYGVTEDIAFDAHEAMKDEDWVFFRDKISLVPQVRYVSVEYYGDKAGLTAQLRTLRSVLQQTEESKRV